VHIDIWLEGADPPEGRVADGDHELRFRGWIELMASLTRLVESGGEADGEFGARTQPELGEDV
jgi:hypothetical protein